MADSRALSIHNLSCSYTRNIDDRVLYVEHLDIPKGKVVFLIGASGSGKSTLLETLGLMNDTVVSGSIRLQLTSNEEIELTGLWKPGQEHKLHQIRKEQLSFIFQQTNLMENFTAYENICLAQMIKSDVPLPTAMPSAALLMDKVGLSKNQVSTQTLAVHLSGGQRQRLSFVRALNTGFGLLLCDEPTGNLDEANANELVRILRENLGSERTAIVVSHDINLALRYADEIIVITRHSEKNYGEISSDNIYRKEEWESWSADKRSHFREKLSGLFQAPANTSSVDSPENTVHSNSLTYRQLFRQREGRSLMGKRLINLWILTSIISFTLLAIGFANGALTYIDRKLNDPFINWIKVSIPSSKSSADQVMEFTDQLNVDSIRNRYSIDTVTAFKIIPLDFFAAESNQSQFMRGRLVSEDDPMLRDLLSSRICGDTALRDDKDLGIVVTERFLRRLGYLDNAKADEVLFVYLNDHDKDTSREDHGEFRVPVPVRAVVRDLPDKTNYLVTEFFYKAYLETDDCYFDFKTSGSQLDFFVLGDEDLANQFSETLKRARKKFNLIEQINPENGGFEYDEWSDFDVDTAESPAVIYDTLDCSVMTPEKWDYFNREGYIVTLRLNKKPENYTTSENIYHRIEELPIWRENHGRIFRVFDPKQCDYGTQEINNDYLSINFRKGGLDSIESFSQALVGLLNDESSKDMPSLEIDSEKIREKKNLNYLSKMTIMITTLLLIFAVLSICLFLSNLLRSHLEKVKMNLGTLKAFGMSDEESISIYLDIMARFVIQGVIISFLIAVLGGVLLDKVMGSVFVLEERFSYFHLFEIRTLFAVSLLLITTWVVSRITIKKILTKSPGDLIYNR